MVLKKKKTGGPKGCRGGEGSRENAEKIQAEREGICGIESVFGRGAGGRTNRRDHKKSLKVSGGGPKRGNCCRLGLGSPRTKKKERNGHSHEEGL